MRQLTAFLDLIKFEHTIFALPFAYLGMALAANGLPSFEPFFWITIAMAAARTFGMSVNRLADRHIDARNPRTAGRPLQTGRIRVSTVMAGLIASLIALTVAAWQLHPLTLALLPGALVFLTGYAYTKRFTWLSHFVLGFTDGLAPMGAWAAIRGSLFSAHDAPAWLLLGTVTFWIAGFDLIYACQDAEFDRAEGLHSIPARFGIPVALRLAQACHAVTVGLLALVGLTAGLGAPYWIALLVAAALLAYEHTLVKPNDLSRVNVAFFNVNGYVSVTLCAGVLAGLYIR